MEQENESQARKLAELIRKHNDGIPPTEQDMLFVIDQAQQETERIEHLVDNVPPSDKRIIIRVDGNPQLYRFSSEEALANWIVEGWTK